MIIIVIIITIMKNRTIIQYRCVLYTMLITVLLAISAAAFNSSLFSDIRLRSFS